jgi:hypothetical protein
MDPTDQSAVQHPQVTKFINDPQNKSVILKAISQANIEEKHTRVLTNIDDPSFFHENGVRVDEELYIIPTHVPLSLWDDTTTYSQKEEDTLTINYPDEVD